MVGISVVLHGVLHLENQYALFAYGFLPNRCIFFTGCYAATSQPNNSTCSKTVSVAFSCLFGG